MEALMFLSSMVVISALGLYIHSIFEQRVEDAKKIAHMGEDNYRMRRHIEQLEKKIRQLEAF